MSGWDYVLTDLRMNGREVVACGVGPECCGALIPAILMRQHDLHHESVPPAQQPSQVQIVRIPKGPQ